MKPFNKPLILNISRLILAGAGGALLIAASLYLYLSPKLPTVETLKEVKLQTPLRIFSQDLQLIGEYGDKRRSPISFEEIPQPFLDALLSAEDDRFYDHSGVDFKGLMRAVVQLIRSGEIQGGGSTITMQVARNFFLTREQTFTRKFNEILLSFRIEDELSKNEILTLYANKIYLGNRAYGIEAAAQVYYGKSIKELSLAQLAMIAGLPKAPSRFNPIANPDRALERRNWILGRMLKLGRIDQEQHKQAVNEPITASYHGYQAELNAPYVAEMARQKGLDLFGKELYSAGYRIYTTIEGELQRAGRAAVRNGLMTYDWRHGYHGPERRIANPSLWLSTLNETPVYGGLTPALVTEVGEKSLILLLRSGETIELLWEDGLKGLRRFITADRRSAPIEMASDIFRAGDLIRIKPDIREDGSKGWTLSQIPKAQSALIALDPNNGAIRTLVGGFDYYLSKYNRITQADRQPGSNFKPFIYATALDKGLTAATTISGAPITIRDAGLEGYWRPENDAGKVYGPTRMRVGLYKSLNTVSVRLLRTIGISTAIDGAARFGFDPTSLPRNATLILGSHAVPPIKIAAGYAAFANGGYRVSPHIVNRIEDVNGNIVYQATPDTVCQGCLPLSTPQEKSNQLPEAELAFDDLETELAIETPAENTDTLEQELDLQDSATATLLMEQIAEPSETMEPETPELPPATRIMDARVAYIMDSMLKDVIKKGTGRRARALKRGDIAGKTGTTNDARDAWFSGYSPNMVATAWVGFDDNSPLGRKEYGGSAALPIWIDFMRVALDGANEVKYPQPDGLVVVRIDPKSGARVGAERTDAPLEVFRQEHVPPISTSTSLRGNSVQEPLPEDLF